MQESGKLRRAADCCAIDISIVKLLSLQLIWSFAVMAVLTVRKLPDAVHNALRLRAAKHGRSTEAEVRDILEKAVKPEPRVRLGDALADLGVRLGLTDEDFAVFDEVRDKTPAVPVGFE